MTPRHPTRGFDTGEGPTPGPTVAQVSTEEIRSIARDVAQAVGNEAQRECVEKGPICTVWKEIAIMRLDISGMRLEQTKLLAVLGFWKWALPVIAALVGAGATLLTGYLRLGR